MSLLFQTLVLLVCFQAIILQSAETSSDYSTLVYKNCTGHTSASGVATSYLQSRSSFFQEIIAQSSQKKFFKTTQGDEDTAISGHFQCRGDLSMNECYKCINTLPEMSNTLCHEVGSARIQLHGCYVHYQTDEFTDESSKPELLHKTCGEQMAETGAYEVVRDAAFAAMESGVLSGDGYYTGTYDSMQMMAQCEEDLGECDCGECVSTALQIAQEDCGISLSGQVYMDRCFVSYTYYPDGIPGSYYPGGGGIGGRGRGGGGGGGNSIGKSAAIVLGGAVAVCLGLIFLVCIKNLGKKDDDC